MTAQSLALVAGSVISLVFEYVPGVQSWYNELTDKAQRLVMLFVLLLVPTAALGFTCIGWYEYFPCSAVGIKEAIEMFVAAVLANQTTYALILKKD
jgi:hypothetical protein